MSDDTATRINDLDTPHLRTFVRDVMVSLLVEGKRVSVARVRAITGMSEEWVSERLAEARDVSAAQESLERAYEAAAPWSDVPLFEVAEPAPAAAVESVPVVVERPLCTQEREDTKEVAEGLEELPEAFEQVEQSSPELEPVTAAAHGRRWFRRKSLAEKRFSRQQRFAHRLDLLGDKGNYTASSLRIRGEVERAKLAGRGARAAARRELETDPMVLADRLTRQRRRATLIAGLLIIGAMAFTSVNVHEFVAGSAPRWSPLWLTGWFVDPVLTGLVVWLLWTRADMAAVNAPINRRRERFIYRVMLTIELVTLAATVTMNIIPELSKENTEPGKVFIHLFIPLVGVAAIFALPLIQSLYADRINKITDTDNAVASVSAHIARNLDEQPKDSDSDGLSERVQIGMSKVCKAIESGTLALPLSVNKVASFIRSSDIGKCSIPTAQEIVRHLRNEFPELTAS